MNERPLNTDTGITDVASFHSPMNDSGHPLCRCLPSRCGAQGGGRGRCSQDRGKISLLFTSLFSG